MNVTFKAPLFRAWTLTDTNILVGRDVIPLSMITKVDYAPVSSSMKNGVVQVWYAGRFFTLPFPYSQREEGDKAAKYIIENYGK